MARTEVYAGPTDLVYQVYQGQVIFADRETALYVAQFWDALNSRTWTEFRAKLPRGGLDDFLEHLADEHDEDELDR